MIREHVAALAALALSACTRDAAPGRRPDVILITLDTVRADRLSCHGYELPTTPNLDRLAADGVRFEQCAATAALTPVSHASILTGLDPYQHGLRVLHAQTACRLPDSVPTLATVLARAGYSTAAILSAFPVSEVFGFERDFAHFDNGMTSQGEERKNEQRAAEGERDKRRPKTALDQPRAGTQRRSDATSDAVLAWLDATPSPAFAWVHYWDVHDPILVPPPAEVREFKAAAQARLGRAPELYDVELNYMDAQIGRVLDRLRADGRYDDALIIVTSDHGEGLGEHGWHAHRLLYEEQLHVPLIVKLPRGPQRVVSELVRTIDIYPTVLETLDLAAPQPVEGRSLVPLARGRADQARFAYADQLNKWDAKADMLDQRPQDDLLHCLRSGDWKLIYRPLRPETSELYDLAGDPDEARNLYAQRADRAQALLDELERRRPWVLSELGAGASDDRAADALRELGYLGDDEH